MNVLRFKLILDAFDCSGRKKDSELSTESKVLKKEVHNQIRTMYRKNKYRR